MVATHRYRAGVDLGGTKVQTVILDRRNRVLGSDRRPTPTVGGPDDVADTLADSVRAGIQNAGVDVAGLSGIGVGSPGQIDIAHGTVSHAGNLPGWSGTFPLGPELSQRLGGVPVGLGNDVQVAVNAEVRLGSGRGFKSLLGVFCGTGIGGGLVINRKLWLGRGAAGEIGHTIVEVGGAKCNCGRRGCVEAYAGRAELETAARRMAAKGKKTKLFKIMKRRGRDRLSSGVWAKALAHGDKMAIELIDRATFALGVGIANAVNLTDIEAVVIGGGLGSRLGDPFVDAINTVMLDYLVMPTRPPAVLLAQLGDLGGAIGAGLLVQNLDHTNKASITQLPSPPAAPTASR